MGLSVGRSWSRLDALEGNYRQKLTNLLEIDFSNTPTKGLAWPPPISPWEFPSAGSYGSWPLVNMWNGLFQLFLSVDTQFKDPAWPEHIYIHTQHCEYIYIYIHIYTCIYTHSTVKRPHCGLRRETWVNNH